MRIGVFAFGKLRTAGLREAADHYRGLLRPWAGSEEFELRPETVPDKSASTRERVRDAEAELLRERLAGWLGPRGRLYLLDEGGKALSTADWAELIRGCEGESVPAAAFCVGGSLGFSSALRKTARAVISLGPQTLPHELARVVLWEQLFRATSVVRGHPYHNV